MKFLVGLGHVVFAISFAAAAEISGIVTEVHDGDSLTLVTWNATYRIRLVDIDAPEMSQAYGKDARSSLFHMCALRKSTADASDEDRYGRMLATVRCGGINANVEQVRRGWAWVFERYAAKDSPLYLIQAEAQRMKRGLWAGDAPIPPWEWRRYHQK
jgi:endonuclease YncB( thermonuclease family)